MKSASKRWPRRSFILTGVPGLLTVPTLWLLQAGLHIKVDPLSSSGGWQPLVAWFFLFWLVAGFWQRWAARLAPAAQPRPFVPLGESDLYTAVQAELAAERTASKA